MKPPIGALGWLQDNVMYKDPVNATDVVYRCVEPWTPEAWCVLRQGDEPPTRWGLRLLYYESVVAYEPDFERLCDRSLPARAPHTLSYWAAVPQAESL